MYEGTLIGFWRVTSRKKPGNQSRWFRAEQLASSTLCFHQPNKNKSVYLVLIWVYLTDEQAPRLEELMSCPAAPCKCTCKYHLGPIRALLWIVFNPKTPQTHAYSLQFGVSLLVSFEKPSGKIFVPTDQLEHGSRTPFLLPRTLLDNSLQVLNLAGWSYSFQYSII